jgi:DNA polymerase-1
MSFAKLNKTVLIDGNNLLHRSYAVTDDSFADKSIGMIHNMLSMLSNWLMSIDDTNSILLFLDGSPIKRRVLYSEYKAGRKKDDGKKSLFDILNSESPFTSQSIEENCKTVRDVVVYVFSLLGVDIFHHPDEETDDVIASYINQHPKDLNIIVSSDVDFFPLLVKHPTTVIYRPGISGNRFFDREVAEEYLLKKFKTAVPLNRIELFKSMTGDASDNIRGVPFLRKKVASALCNLGSISEIIDSGIPGASKSEKEKIIALKDTLELNLKLIKLIDDLDVGSMRIKSINDHKLANSVIKNDIGLGSFQSFAFSVGNSRIRCSDAIATDPDYAWLTGV